jgi:dTDP-4-amino-4,6-dideoxygalactose transaminase
LVTGTHRLDALQAAILDVKLRHLDDWNASRQAAAAMLAEAIADTDVTLPAAPAEDGDHVYHLFVITTPERDALRDHLDACGVSSAIHYPTPVHLQPAYADRGLGLGSLPVAERLAGESCSLPVFPAIEDWHIAETAAAVQSFGAAGNS